MAALDPQARISILERELHSANRELHWANFTIQKRDAQIRLLEERLRQRVVGQDRSRDDDHFETSGHNGKPG